MRQLAERVPSVAFRSPGELIRYTRKKMGLSQKYLASASNMSASGLSKVESGHHLLPRNIFKLSDALKIDPRVLVSLGEKHKKDAEPRNLDDFKKEFPNWKDLIKEGLKELN